MFNMKHHKKEIAFVSLSPSQTDAVHLWGHLMDCPHVLFRLLWISEDES